MPKFIATFVLLLGSFTVFATGSDPGCAKIIAPRPLGLVVPNAKAELSRLSFRPPSRVTNPRELDETFAKLIPPGVFEVMLSSEHRFGDQAVALEDKAMDRLRLAWDSPALTARGIALRATFSKNGRTAVKVDVPFHEASRFDVGFSQNRYHVSLSSLRSTLVLQYDPEGRLMKIFAIKRERPITDRGSVRGSYYQVLIPAS